MHRAFLFLLAAMLAVVAAQTALAQRGPAPNTTITEIASTQLPREARDTLALIKKGGPYSYAKDGSVFSNREGRLPRQKRGYYHEFTVKTPAERTRGARRIITGQPGEYWYTDDHYATFRRIRD
jgi:ribonuclease T1